MGSFNTLYEFISNRVRVLSKDGDHTDDPHTPIPASVVVVNNNYSHQRYYSDSNAALLQKEAIQELFPCDDRHSFNPHYQHNLHSTDSASLPYSTPPSLSSSPTNSSPTSTTSASSRRSQNNGYYPTRQYQYQQQQQQQQPHMRRSASVSNSKSTYSYHRHQTRRQNQRNHANHGQYYEYMDDDMMIGYDNPHQNNSNRFSISSSSSSSMARVHPQGSSSYTSFSTSANSDLRFSPSLQGRRSISTLPSASENERRMVASSSVPSFPAAIEDAAAGEGSLRSSRPTLSTIAESAQPSKAQLSLMRIAQCDRRVDSWCTQQAGQWTRHYAETSSCGVMADGRRTRRM
ncbi:hypothetical protein EMPS_02782 [Entomortierella parvispora]|uniref:Uncharacterized protein n=1 Tax=Entomortierella parvispora TaxID=205924 RepID=A0A9P3LTW7_9FUNG|nr:hypothetical protein EMPS_02782 [Entomortierella parvispora]